MTLCKNLESLSTIGELDQELQEIEQRQREIACELGEITKTSDQILKNYTRCLDSRPAPSILKAPTKSMQDMLEHASVLAAGISYKVRRLDSTKKKVQNTMEIIEKLFVYRECANKLEKAVQEEIHEEAARLISQYRALDVSLISLGEEIYKNLNFSQTKFDDIQTKLEKELSSTAQTAVQVQDSQAVTRICRYFSQMGKTQLGVDIMWQFLRSLARDRLLDQVIKIEGSDARSFMDHLQVAVKVLETFASIVTEYQPVILQDYQQSQFEQIIIRLQQECDELFKRTVDAFKRFAQLDKLAIKCRMTLAAPSSVMADTSSSNDPMQTGSALGLSGDLGHLVSNISLLNTHATLYLRFIARRVTDSDFTQSAVAKHLDEMVEFYILFEKTLLSELINKALQSEEVDAEGRCYRFVDDVFFLVKKTICRSLTCGRGKTICSIVDMVTELIEERVIQGRILQSRLQAGLSINWLKLAASTTTRLSGLTTSTSKAHQSTKLNFIWTLNTVECLVQNISKLAKELLVEITDHEKKFSVANFQAITHSINQVGAILLEKAREQLTRGFKDVLLVSLRETIKQNVEPFKLCVSVLTEADMDNYAVNDPWMNACINSLENVIQPFRQGLSPGNYEKLLALLVDEFVLQLEKALMKKTFNKLGAMRLDIELRSVTSYFTRCGSWSTREKMSRITQICCILNVDSLDEIAAFWNSSNWALSPSEIRSILKLRVEFSTADIKRLQF